MANRQNSLFDQSKCSFKKLEGINTTGSSEKGSIKLSKIIKHNPITNLKRFPISCTTILVFKLYFKPGQVKVKYFWVIIYNQEVIKLPRNLKDKSK